MDNAKKYSRIKYTIALFEMAFTSIFLLVIYLSGFSNGIKAIATSVSANQIVLIAAYTVFLSAFFSICTFFLDYYSGFSLEHRFKLSRQKFPSWFKDYLKKMLIGGILYIIIVESLYFFIRNFEATWWLWAAIFYLFFSLILAKIFPVFIIPLFYKLQRLDDADIRKSLLQVASKTRVKILDIYKIGFGAKTKKANAALTGIGATKRILLSDTLLNNYTPEEIKATLAHELAHYKYRHMWKLILFNLCSTLIIFYTVHLIFTYIQKNNHGIAIYDISSLPLLAFLYMLLNIILIPVQTAISRRFEYQADAEAVRMTKAPSAFISLITKLTKQNLGDPDPLRIIEIFFYDHPPASKRIRAVRSNI